MFSKIRQRFRDMKTIAALCTAAEKHVNAGGQREPGAEHFVLAALDLPDGTARRAFERAGGNPDAFRDAIEQQYRDALCSAGIDSASGAGFDNVSPVPASTGIYQPKASAQALMQMMAEIQRDSSAPLLGAHVIVAATKPAYGTVIRALRAMEVDVAALAGAAEIETGVLRAS